MSKTFQIENMVTISLIGTGYNILLLLLLQSISVYLYLQVSRPEVFRSKSRHKILLNNSYSVGGNSYKNKSILFCYKDNIYHGKGIFINIFWTLINSVIIISRFWNFLFFLK